MHCNAIYSEITMLKLHLLLTLLASCVAQQEYRHGLIILHPLGGDGGGGPAGTPLSLCSIVINQLLLDHDVKIVCPQAEIRPHSLLKPFRELLPFLPERSPSWFDFTKFPDEAVVSRTESSNTAQLREAASLVESTLFDMIINLKIPSSNIVVMGVSQGGAITLYEAVHSIYKLGGFISVVTWYPNLLSDFVRSRRNKDTPILHLNGLADPIVTLNAGDRTADVLQDAFKNYRLVVVPGDHLTTILPANLLAWNTIKEWLEEHELLGRFQLEPHEKCRKVPKKHYEKVVDYFDWLF